MLSKTRLLARVAPFSSYITAASHPYRAAILFLLSENDEMEVWELAGRIGISSPLISHHLKILYQHQWLKKMRLGKRVFYRIEEKAKEFVTSYLLKK